jgi:hypothetical protein
MIQLFVSLPLLQLVSGQLQCCSNWRVKARFHGIILACGAITEIKSLLEWASPDWCREKEEAAEAGRGKTP